MFLCPVTVSAAVVPATLREQQLLELQFDGPIPSSALADLRRNPHRCFAAATLTDVELAEWQALAWRNLKAEQRRLWATRKHACRMRRQWCLRQCVATRREWQIFAAETARRQRAIPAHVRTLTALNKALGV